MGSSTGAVSQTGYAPNNIPGQQQQTAGPAMPPEYFRGAPQEASAVVGDPYYNTNVPPPPPTDPSLTDQSLQPAWRGGRFASGGTATLPSLPKLPMKFPRFGAGFRGVHGLRHLQHGGFINSSVPGRTDKHYVTVQSGSYVLPADHVSALGQNNSNAGAHVIRQMFAPGTKFGPRLAIPKFAAGGSVEPVPIVVAGGEIVLPPNIVRRIGNGDLTKGHDVLDKWVLATREKHIKKLKSLKPPKGSDE